MVIAFNTTGSLHSPVGQEWPGASLAVAWPLFQGVTVHDHIYSVTVNHLICPVLTQWVVVHNDDFNLILMYCNYQYYFVEEMVVYAEEIFYTFRCSFCL